MALAIVSGIHPIDWTADLLDSLKRQPSAELSQQHKSQKKTPDELSAQTQVFTISPLVPPYSPSHLFDALEAAQGAPRSSPPLTVLAFSAGVVGAIGAARRWQTAGGSIRALIAVDGWGVPLIGSFPVHRLSHDPFTHWTAGYTAGQMESFYADPPVSHEAIWRSPQQAQGWICREGKPISQLTALQFLQSLLARYEDTPTNYPLV